MEAKHLSNNLPEALKFYGASLRDERFYPEKIDGTMPNIEEQESSLGNE